MDFATTPSKPPVLYIPYVNEGREVLRRCVLSLTPDAWRNVYVYDMSPAGDARWFDLPEWVTVLRLVPGMPFTSVQNWLQQQAIVGGDPWYAWMHADGVVVDGADRVLIDYARNTWGERWGLLFTYYDTLTLFRTAAVVDVGPWDTALSQYVSDNDYYLRMRRYGWETRNTDLHAWTVPLGPHVLHDAPSTAKRSDPAYAIAVDFFNQRFNEWFRSKWGSEESPYWAPHNGNTYRRLLAHLRSLPIYAKLSATRESNEGNLLELTDDSTAISQIETIERGLRRAVAAANGERLRIVETGTNKGMFGLLLSHIAPGARLWTFDDQPGGQLAAEILDRETDLDVTFCLGDSVATFTFDAIGGAPPHLAWIDGGHDATPALSDVSRAMAFGAATILVDDTNMPQVESAINTALATHPDYTREPNTLTSDARRIAILSRASGITKPREA